MIRIETEGPIGREFEAWRARAENARSEMLREYRERDQPPDPERYQRIWKDFKAIFLIPTFHAKCAFCEATLQLANFAPDVEHYRPKKGVTVDRYAIDHPGYFWLACEWYNLLLVCRNCNSGHSDVVAGDSTGHPGKATEFPIDGDRVLRPSEDPTTWANDLQSEKPLLLHPYFDDPEDHIAFSDLGVPYARGASKRGLATIKACHLDREGLCSARREVANDLARRRLHTAIETKGKSLCQPQDPFFAWLKHGVPMVVKEILEGVGMKVKGLSVS